MHADDVAAVVAGVRELLVCHVGVGMLVIVEGSSSIIIAIIIIVTIIITTTTTTTTITTPSGIILAWSQGIECSGVLHYGGGEGLTRYSVAAAGYVSHVTRYTSHVTRHTSTTVAQLLNCDCSHLTPEDVSSGAVLQDTR